MQQADAVRLVNIGTGADWIVLLKEYEAETGSLVVRKTDSEGQGEWNTDIVREARKAVRRGEEGLGGEVKHYRDNSGLECDAVVHLEDGRWGGIEIKLGGDDLINDGAESLKRLRDKIVQKSDEKAPSFLLVLTAVGGAYKREDGVYVAPINMLKP